MYSDARDGLMPAGPMAGELIAEFETLRRDIGDFPGSGIDEALLRKRLRHRAATLRVGALAHCFFEPARARCLQHVAMERRTEPVTGQCDPRCPQACWTKRYHEPWSALRDEIGTFPRLNRISPIQREVLARQLALADEVLREIEGGRRAP